MRCLSFAVDAAMGKFCLVLWVRYRVFVSCRGCGNVEVLFLCRVRGNGVGQSVLETGGDEAAYHFESRLHREVQSGEAVVSAATSLRMAEKQKERTLEEFALFYWD